MQTQQTRVQSGRVVIPAEMRHALGLKAGDEVVLRLEGGEIHLASLRDSVRQARTLFRQHVSAGTPAVEDLIAERRREAADE